MSPPTNRNTRGRAHLHTTISLETRDVLQSLVGDGRINDVLEDAIRYYSRKQGMPDCEECETMSTFRLRESLINSIDMGLVSSQLLEVLANCGMGIYPDYEMPQRLQETGRNLYKILHEMETIPENIWQNSFDSFLYHSNLLKTMGVFSSFETHLERNGILATLRILPDHPEIPLLMLVAMWEAAGHKRILELWKQRKEYHHKHSESRPIISLSSTLVEWLINHTIEDTISDKILYSIRESFNRYNDLLDDSKGQISECIQGIVEDFVSWGLLETADTKKDGDLIRVHFRCRNTNLKNLSLKLIRAFLSLEGLEEVTREEGVTTAILYFGLSSSLYL
jgi:hypothetical protein